VKADVTDRFTNNCGHRKFQIIVIKKTAFARRRSCKTLPLFQDKCAGSSTYNLQRASATKTKIYESFNEVQKSFDIVQIFKSFNESASNDMHFKYK